MAIAFMRVDDRIIHGQVVTRWLSEIPADGVIAVDDDAANSQVISQVLKSAVPGGLKSFVLTVDDFVEKWPKISESTKKYFLVAKTPVTFKRILEAGIDLTSELNTLNVGPMSERKGAVKVGPNANLLPDELDAFEFLKEKGFTTYFQLVPDSKKIMFDDISY